MRHTTHRGGEYCFKFSSPGVAGAVLQTPLSHINSIINSGIHYVNILNTPSLNNLKS